jgi:MFS family permease
MLSAVINYVDRGSLSTAAPLLQDEFRLNPSQLGILFSSFFCAYAVCMLAAGWLADHLNVNWVLAAGFFFWWAATVATGLAYGFVVLFVARLVLGMGESVSFPCYSTLLARHFSNQRRGIANAVLATGMAIGPALGMFTGGVLMARFGWRPVFIGLGLVGMLWLPAWRKWMPQIVCIEILRQSAFSRYSRDPEAALRLGNLHWLCLAVLFVVSVADMGAVLPRPRSSLLDDRHGQGRWRRVSLQRALRDGVRLAL